MYHSIIIFHLIMLLISAIFTTMFNYEDKIAAITGGVIVLFLFNLLGYSFWVLFL